LYEYVTMRHNRGFVNTINNHPRLRKMKEWVSKYKKYERYTKKISLASDPYSYMDRGREQREFLKLRDDILSIDETCRGIPQGYYNYDIDNLRDQHRQQRMSVPIEPRQIVKKESVFKRIINKLKLK